MTSQILDETLNPCVQEHMASLRCQERTNYEHGKCEDAFENYRMCKKFWGKVYSMRKRSGTYPYLPLPEERKQIKEDYLSGKLKI